MATSHPHTDAGTTTDSDAATASEQHRDRLRIIRKLLTRAESTDFESERDACLAKVADLMARHSIEEALVRDSLAGDTPDGDRRPTERLMVVPAPYAARKVQLFGAVGAGAGCTVIDIGSDDNGLRRVAVIGFPGDLDRVELLTTSLLVQLTRSMLAEGPRAARSNPGATAAWRRSFITGFVVRVGQRLAEANAAERIDHHRSDGAGRAPGAGSSTALVLARRDEAVDREVRLRYPYLRTKRMDGGSSADGHRAGRAAGDRAGLGSEAIGGRRALGA